MPATEAKPSLKKPIAPAKGRLAVLTPGMGSVATTFYAGVEAIKKGLAKPIGSYTQLGQIRLGKRTDNSFKKIGDLVSLASLDQLVFGGWDIFPENAYESAKHAHVLESELLEQIKEPLSKIVPMKAVFDQSYVKRLHGTHTKTGKNKMELAE